MMRSVMVTATAFVMLAACSPAGPKGSEEELAAKIVDAQGVLDLGEQTLMEVVNAQIQSVAMQNPNLTQEQGQKLQAAIRANIEAELPALKKDMAGFLAETFDAKELQTYYDFVGSTEGDTIKNRIPPVMQKSLEAADKMTTKAVDKAVAEVMGAPADAAAPAAPADGAAPAAPAAEPAKPTKPQ
jgi:hypothetical protein